ncbi:hypothetical protein HJC23_004836 [Cyclotella cryptica]|uniref:Disease resistance R13L4/SHOC-2-like LRR domain-containing protein n=1 Tax=Cyclotella cryptica TaxID=29204 RepID=A0ABD3P917_9STRA
MRSRHQIILQQLNDVTKFSDEWFRLKAEEAELRCYLASDESRVVEEGVFSTINSDGGVDKPGGKNLIMTDHDCARSITGPETIEDENQAPHPATFIEALTRPGHYSASSTSKTSLSEKKKDDQKILHKSGNRPRPSREKSLFDNQILSDELPLPSLYDPSAIGHITDCKDSSGYRYDYDRKVNCPEISDEGRAAPFPITFCRGEEKLGLHQTFSQPSLSGKSHTLKNVLSTETDMFEMYNNIDMQTQDSAQSINSQQSDHSLIHRDCDKSHQSNGGRLSASEGMLVVAYPKEEPSIDEPIYEASEYDPSLNTSCYKSVRCRLYTTISLLITGAIVTVGVVYGLKKDIGDNAISYIPTQSPKTDLVTDRESLGLQDIIENHVLERHAKFRDMEDWDPRYLALEWILRDDKFHDNTNLFQRYILALLAFSYDSNSWNCGGLYDVESCNKTEVVDDYALWLSGTSECFWYGVTCDDDVVKGLDLCEWSLIQVAIYAKLASIIHLINSLSSNNLIGEIPPEIGGLRFLERLVLYDNCLYGTLPFELWKLASLIEIDFGGNALSGTISSDLYALSSLTILNLASNKNEGNCNHTDGTATTVSSTGFEGDILGPKIGQLTKLREIQLFTNNFSGSVSSEIGRLNQLEVVDAHSNALSGSLPKELSQLFNLMELRLAGNKINGSITERIGNMKALEALSLSGMAMVGTIPDSLYNLTNLRELHLRNNKPGFNGPVKSEIGNLLQLEELVLYDNPLLSGTLPSELGLCQNLRVIQLQGTKITGTVPKEVCSLRDMKLNFDFAQWTEEFFKVDCLPKNETLPALIHCDCCSTCCDHTTKSCFNM